MIARIAGAALIIVLGLTTADASARAGEPRTQVVPAERIAAFAEHIARALVPDSERALAPAFRILDQSVPLGTVAIVAAGKPQVNATYIGVPVAIAIEGHVARTMFAGFRITSYVRMPVAAHDVAAGAILNGDDIAYARVPFDGRPARDADAFIGRKVRSLIARGDVLVPELTVVNEIVHAGMPAVLIVRDGPVRLAADVVARSSGGLGDYVSIFDPQTQRVLSAVVTGPDTVELALPGGD
jgi:flagella basal body P-ring formation protein FlgA